MRLRELQRIGFPHPGFNMLASRTVEREQFVVRIIILNTEKPHPGPALGAVWLLNYTGPWQHETDH
jgi:hypothetical protein